MHLRGTTSQFGCQIPKTEVFPNHRNAVHLDVWLFCGAALQNAARSRESPNLRAVSLYCRFLGSAALDTHQIRKGLGASQQTPLLGREAYPLAARRVFHCLDLQVSFTRKIVRQL